MQGICSLLSKLQVGIALHVVFGIALGSSLGAHNTLVYSTFENEYALFLQNDA